jgi:adenylate kinase family enzyme
LGPTGSGKTSYIKQANSFGAIYINFSKYIIEFAENQSPDTKEVILRMINENGMLTPALTIDILGSLYRNEPYASKGFILEGFPQNRDDVETMMRNQFLVDSFIDIKVPAETCARRLYCQNFKDAENSGGSEEDLLSNLAAK